jgi:roadblock/LC7 domain-containing protein
MKKLKINTVAAIAVYVMLAVVLSSCGTESLDGKPSEIVTTGSVTYYSVSTVDYYATGMHYKVFISANGGVFVVNVTKDSLEVAKNNH